MMLSLVISTHALREEGDRNCSSLRCALLISTHALREEGDLFSQTHTRADQISTHALREEGDEWETPQDLFDKLFLPTPSVRRATVGRPTARPSGFISTHALREEGDGVAGAYNSKSMNFYPRPPRGGRPHPGGAPSCRPRDFYPRPPRGGRPHGFKGGDVGGGISTHALREEGDTSRDVFWTAATGFLPTPSARRATRR